MENCSCLRVPSPSRACWLPGPRLRQRYIGDTNAIISGRNAGTLQSARSLVHADGLLLSNFMTNGWNGGPRWGMVAPQSIASVEVLYGPYSALYPGDKQGNWQMHMTAYPAYLYAEAAPQRLDYLIDPDWGGETPRTLVIHADGTRTASSGELTATQLQRIK